MTMEEQLRHRVLANPPKLVVTDSEIAQLDEELASLLSSIRSKPTLASAGDDLDHLSAFQEMLATMFFKYEIELTDQQKFVVRNFERGDDPDLRAYFFQRLKTS